MSLAQRVLLSKAITQSKHSLVLLYTTALLFFEQKRSAVVFRFLVLLDSITTQHTDSNHRYLSCDKYGLLNATRDAISPEESFTCTPEPAYPGTFSIRTTREKYLTAEEGVSAPEIRGDSETIRPNSAVRVRMQARFKPTFKATKEEKVREKISRAQLEQEAGRRLEDDEVKNLKKARKEGTYYEALLDVKVKNKHDKFA